MKFQKKLFVKIEGRKGEEYFNAYEHIDSTVSAGESAKVGIYELKEVVEARGSVTTVSAKPVKRR